MNCQDSPALMFAKSYAMGLDYGDTCQLLNFVTDRAAAMTDGPTSAELDAFQRAYEEGSIQIQYGMQTDAYESVQVLDRPESLVFWHDLRVLLSHTDPFWRLILALLALGCAVCTIGGFLMLTRTIS